MRTLKRMLRAHFIYARIICWASGIRMRSMLVFHTTFNVCLRTLLPTEKLRVKSERPFACAERQVRVSVYF